MARGLVHFDLGNSGVCEVFYNGATKRKEVLVTNPVPVAFRVDVLVDDGKSTSGAASSARCAYVKETILSP